MKMVEIIKQFLIKVVRGGTTVAELRRYGAVIGEDVEFYDVHCSAKDATCLQIGSHVTLSGVTILTHDASPKRFLGGDCNLVGRVVIGDHVFIGKNTLILPNVHIGDRVIIGAGSVVTRDIPGNSVSAGNPARVLRSVDSFVQEHQGKMQEGVNVYHSLRRDEMSDAQRKAFNEAIDGEKVYLCH